MSNAYCTPSQLFALYDERTLGMLSNDDNTRAANTSRVQTILDIQASELESHLAGRYALPLAIVPAVLTKWVAAKAASQLFGRRSDKPKGVTLDEQWADNWIKQLKDGDVSLPSVDTDAVPRLVDSDFTDGRSRFDRVFGYTPSPTGPSRGI